MASTLRVSRQIVEVLATGNGKLRVSRQAVEVLTAASAPTGQEHDVAASDALDAESGGGGCCREPASERDGHLNAQQHRRVWFSTISTQASRTRWRCPRLPSPLFSAGACFRPAAACGWPMRQRWLRHVPWMFRTPWTRFSSSTTPTPARCWMSLSVCRTWRLPP